MALANKTAVVFGGSGGIGMAIEIELLKAGVTKLFVSDVQVLSEYQREHLKEANGKAEIFFGRCDVADIKQVTKLLKKDALDKLGSIDILVNSAGTSDETDWQRLIAINLVGVINTTLVGIEVMSRSRGGNGGTIANLASVNGLVPVAGLPIYAASKFGIVGFMRSVETSAPLTDDGLKLINICPTGTLTTMPTGAKPALPIFEQAYKESLTKGPLQDPRGVGQCVVETIVEADSGTTWIIHNETNVLHDFPEIPFIAKMYPIK